jgi:hypothetical protein
MDDTTPTLAEIEAYARRHGLTNLSPEQMKRLRSMAGNITRAGCDVPRVTSKFMQPANVLRVTS